MKKFETKAPPVKIKRHPFFRDTVPIKQSVLQFEINSLWPPRQTQHRLQKNLLSVSILIPLPYSINGTSVEYLRTFLGRIRIWTKSTRSESALEDLNFKVKSFFLHISYSHTKN